MEDQRRSQGGFRTAQQQPLEVPDPLGLGPPTMESRREFPIGTRRMTRSGYITVKTATGWESEARLVLDHHLGRFLRSDEEARHRRGYPRWDNRLEALELWRNGRPVRIPRRTPRPRTNWKRLHKANQCKLAVAFDGAAEGQPLTAAQLAAVREALVGWPGDSPR